MEDSFRSFIDQVPEKNISGVAMHGTADIIVMRPASYVLAEVCMPDYHFAFPSSPLPPTKIGNKVFQFNKGRMVAFPLDTNVRCMEEIPTRPYIALSIKREFFNDTARSAMGRESAVLTRFDNPFNPDILNSIQELEAEIEDFNYSCPLMLQSMSTQIVVQILRTVGSPLAEKARPMDKHYVDVAREYIMTYYNSNIKTEDICKQINISPYHFIRMFKEKTGVTPHEFLQFIRLDKAEEMLRTGNFTVEEVARLCGYVNTDHFSRRFRQVKGTPPSEYRKTYFSFESQQNR